VLSQLREEAQAELEAHVEVVCKEEKEEEEKKKKIKESLLLKLLLAGASL